MMVGSPPAPTAAPTPVWGSTIYSGQNARTRGWQYVTTTVLEGDIDDDCYDIPIPFNFTFLDQKYTTVHIGTNGYLTFGGCSSTYGGFGAQSPSLRTIFIVAADLSAQRIGYHSDGRLYTFIRFEGTDDNNGVLGSPTVVFEVVLTVYGFIEIRVGPNKQSTYTTGVTTGSQWVASSIPLRSVLNYPDNYESAILSQVGSGTTLRVTGDAFLKDTFSGPIVLDTFAPTQVKLIHDSINRHFSDICHHD